MAPQDFSQTTTTTSKSDYAVPSVTPNSPTSKDENYWDNPNFTRWFGKYINVAKIKKALDGYADWVLGQGYTTDTKTKIMLEHIQGNGKESFDDIMWNAIILKKVNGESYTHVIRDPENKETGVIINMRPLNPQYMRTVYSGKGRVKEYRYYGTPERNEGFVTYKPNEILHMFNDKVVDEMAGRSVIEAVEWNIEAQEEAKRVHRKLVWRSGVVRVIEVDTSNAAELTTLKAQYKIAEEKGDVLLLPKDKARVADWKPNMDVAGILAWLDYLDNEFYISIGFPRDLAGASTSATEAGMKMSYITHQPLYEKEVKEMEEALWNQLGIKITFNRVENLLQNEQQNEMKNTNQTQMMPVGAGQ